MSTQEKKLGLRQSIRKSKTGILGLDQITGGGLPQGRPTLVCGSAGCGKTMLAIEFLVRGAVQFQEPGLFMSFEETEHELSENVASMGFDLPDLCASNKLFIDYVRVDKGEIQVSGEYNLEGLFIRLASAIKAVGAKRVVLDTIEALFSAFTNTDILRAELRRLFGWLKARGITAVITAETSGGVLTRHGIEEFVADCVLFLDHRIEHETSIRRLRVVKYRGTAHGTSEYPFLIGENGFSVFPYSSLKLDHKAPTERVSSGIPSLDVMLGGKGFYRGMSVLVSGEAGTGKTSLAAHFVRAACERGEHALYMTSEQSGDEVIRNMRSIGIDLQPWIEKGLLRFHAARPGTFGLERHLVTIHDIITTFNPTAVVIDPITDFGSVGAYSVVKSMAVRLIDLFKSHQVTAMFTSLTSGSSAAQLSQVGVSSLMDAWLRLRIMERNGECSRGLYVRKARGMAHSNQIREFVFTDDGIELADVQGRLSSFVPHSTGSQSEVTQIEEATEHLSRLGRSGFELGQRRKELEVEIARLRMEFAQHEQTVWRDADDLKLHQRASDFNPRTIGKRSRPSKIAAKRNSGHAGAATAANL
jgi:circadian clock protein KaiC